MKKFMDYVAEVAKVEEEVTPLGFRGITGRRQQRR